MTPTLLCETVTGRTMAELLAARHEAMAGDMVELRLDGVEDLDVAQALHGRHRPAIVTVRPVWEGGRFEGSEQERRELLARALALGAEFVDVEWRAGFAELVAQAPQRVVLSSHDFNGVPEDLEARAHAMRQSGAAVIKVAVAATRLSDTVPLLEIARGGSAVVIGMGAAGLPTRLLASRMGCPWTYAGDGVAPGQLPAGQMLDRFRFRSVGPQTKVYGVVGGNAMQSLSPTLHNAAFAASGIDAVYVPLQAADFDDFVTFADAYDLSGASVTIPFKLDALRAAQSADDLTRAAGAANTLRRAPAGVWEATNTDVAGFLEPLDAALAGNLRGLRAAVLGAGGAARAIVVALASRGLSVTVHARRLEQAQDVAVLGSVPAVLPPAPGSWDVLVNTTPVGGAARDESPLPGGPFTGRVVYDLTYGPGESRLVREARVAGCLVLDGLPMLVAQAERQFEWWTGQRPAPGVMALSLTNNYASHNV